jgi:hypothetical protein
MVRSVLALLAGFGFLVLPVAQAAAGPNANAGLALHIASVTSSDPCLSTTQIPTCGTLRVDEPILGVPVFLYVLVQDADPVAGVAAATFGVSYDGADGSGVDILGWNLCADSQVASPGWPALGSGLEISWASGNCQHRRTGTGNDPVWTSGTAVIGYFYCAAYTPSNFFVTPHPITGSATVTDCSGIVDDLTNALPSQLGVAGFGGAGGYAPCETMAHYYPCEVVGPDVILAGSTHHYSSGPPGEWGSIWSIEGNGIIVGPSDGTSVQVQAGGPGTFTLYFSGPSSLPPSTYCGKIVTVEDAIPALPTTWSSVKALYGE